MAPWTPIRPAPFQQWPPRNEITRARLESPSPEELREMRPDYDPSLFDHTATRGGHTHDPSHPSHYNPDQPRVSAGNPDGGQWTSEGFEDGDAIGTEVAAVGHHWACKGVYCKAKYNFPPETLKILNLARTGPLLHPENNLYDELHQDYSKAVEEALDRFLKRYKIRRNQMTPAHARVFVMQILASTEPRIRKFRERLVKGEGIDIRRNLYNGRLLLIPRFFRGTE